MFVFGQIRRVGRAVSHTVHRIFSKALDASGQPQ